MIFCFSQVYTSGKLEVKRFYRRLLPALVLGKYQSQPSTDQFKAFAESISKQETTIYTANLDHPLVSVVVYRTTGFGQDRYG